MANPIGPKCRYDMEALRAFAAAIGVDPEAPIVDTGGRPAIIGPIGRISAVRKGRIHPPSDGFLIDCRAASRRQLRRLCQTWTGGMFLDRLPRPNEAELIAAAIGLRETPKPRRGRPRKAIDPAIAPKLSDVAVLVLTRAKAAR